MTTFNLPRMDQSPPAPESSGFGAMHSRHGNLPLAALAYHARIHSLALSTTITQTFYNPFDECIEANYVFPIEGDQAVVRCEMLVGDRVIHADLRERGAAREAYRTAIRKGHRAALLEENRSETFALAVGNIPPGEAIQVRLTTVGQLAVSHGQWTLRLPLVVAPRYVSGFPLPGRSAGNGVAADSSTVPDASTVTPPTLLPNFPNPVDLRLEVEIDSSAIAGGNDWVSSLESSLHAIMVRNQDENGCQVSLHPGERVNRDFVLRGRFDESNITATLLCEPPPESPERSDEATFSIHLIPPKCETTAPRDVSFVLDRSGSMRGWKMPAAARGISRLIDSLADGDRFQLIAFDNQCESPFSNRERAQYGWIDATDQNRWKAVNWLGKISARGGTEMAAAIRNGLLPFQAAERSIRTGGDAMLRSAAMVLVTDGQITGEDSVLRTIESCPIASRPRLFCLGIDRAVNASVLRRLADQTGGTFELVESENRLDEVLQTFASEIGSPAITDLRVQPLGWRCDTLCIAPQNRTDLYHGRAVSIYGRVPRRTDPLRLQVRGILPDGTDWSRELTATTVDSSETETSMLLPLWGRKRVRELEDQFVAGGSSDRGLRESIIRCSLESQVLSRFTAYVAIDETAVVSSGSTPQQITQPVESPEGWQRHLPTIDPALLIRFAKPVPSAISRRSSAEPARGSLDSLPALRDFLRRHVVSDAQLTEAEQLTRQTNASVCDALIQLQYADELQIAKAISHATGVSHVDLRSEQIELATIELIPESVARENSVLPLCVDGKTLTILMSDPTDTETIEKLRFILNRPIQVAVDGKSAILDAINQYYGQVEGETADSMMQEFTDTAIDFTETEYAGFSAEPRSRGPRMTPEAIIMVEDSDSEDGIVEANFESAFANFDLEPETPPLDRMSKRETGPLAVRGQAPTTNGSSPQSAPVVRLVNLMLLEAVQLNATHILIQPDATGVTVGYLIGDKFVRRDTVPLPMLVQIMTRLRIMAQVDVAARKQKTDGSLKLTIGDQPIDAPIHFAPTSQGESALIELVKRETTCDEIRAWWKQVEAVAFSQ